MSARFEGALSLVDGCLGVNGVPAFFPTGSVDWDGTVLTSGDDTYVLGDTIVLGGGEVPAELFPAHIQEECVAENIILVSAVERRADP